MEVTVGTFNLNNLFSRFNFQADLETALPGTQAPPEPTPATPEAGGGAAPTVVSTDAFRFGGGSLVKIRSFRGSVVRAKDPRRRAALAERILRTDLDVLAVQEVEDVVTLRGFAQEDLRGRWPHSVLVEGNDERLIDLAVLSKYPLGAVTSWQHAVHPDVPDRPIFSRDLLQVEVWNERRTRRLFTLFNNHLKSRLVLPGEDVAAETAAANRRRRQQCEVAARIVRARLGSDRRVVVVGDMNDGPDSPHLAPLVADPALGLTDGLRDPTETRPLPPDPGDPPPPSTAWSYRFKPSGKPAEYTLLDQIWLSPALAARQTGATIDRRKTLRGDGTDHDLAWVTLRL